MTYDSYLPTLTGLVLWVIARSPCVIHKEGLCPSSGDINRLVMITTQCKQKDASVSDPSRGWRSASLLGREQSAHPLPDHVDPAIRADCDRPRALPEEVHARKDTVSVCSNYRRAYLDVLHTAVYY
jgi:hypothetical protein